MKFWNTKPATDKYEFNGSTMMLKTPEKPIPAVSKLPQIVEQNEDNLRYLQEYSKLAEQTGVKIKPMFSEIERFTVFLLQTGITVFNLNEVRSYMDELAKKENPDKAGWHWCPLRAKDSIRDVVFGRKAWRGGGEISPAYDYFRGPHFSQNRRDNWGNLQSPGEEPSSSPVYDKQIPLHALRKVALIEKDYKGTVAFFVSDYATAPMMNPDPFLMVIIPNPELHKDVGRFVIDVWDEPGFGIERMVK